MTTTVLGDKLFHYYTLAKAVLMNEKDFVDNQLLRCKKHKQREAEYLLQMPYGSSFLDVGANWGDTVLTMAIHAKNNNRSDIRFYAFEPNRKKCQVIQAISAYNKLNIQVFNNCIGDVEGNVSNDGINNPLWGCTSYKKDEKGNIKMIKLDDLKEQLEPIGLIHVDTEGWEIEVLKGSRKILQDSTSKFILILEYWQDITAKIAHSQGRTNKLLSTTPKLALLDFISWYNFARLEDIHDEESNLVFKKR